VLPDLSFQQRVEDGKSHHGYANPEDRPSDPERDGSADNRKGGADGGNAEQSQSIRRVHLHPNHLTPPIIVVRKEGRIGGPGFRHSSFDTTTLNPHQTGWQRPCRRARGVVRCGLITHNSAHQRGGGLGRVRQHESAENTP